MLRNSLALAESLELHGKRRPLVEMECSGVVRRRKGTNHTVKERFMAMVSFVGECWIWDGKKEKFGYGRFSIRDKEFAAHRVAYTIFKGDISDGLVLDHIKEKCGNPSCVNPDHLEPVTQHENLMRGNTFQARNSRKTHCPKGHSYGAPKNGVRKCAECSRQRCREYKARIAVRTSPVGLVRDVGLRKR